MKSKSILAVVILCVMAVANIATAGFANDIGMEFVTIGNAGNAADSTGFGAVSYNYAIGKYEVTNAQWNAFTTTAGKPTGGNIVGGQDPYDEDAVFSNPQQPTNCVSWYETLQFCNYLTSSDKSLGAYLFSGNNTNPGDFVGVDRDSAVSAYGTVYVLPTVDEWYKTAYYTGSGYSLYANGTDTAPIMGDDTNYHGVLGSPWEIGVGNGSEEQNGTFDMMGNVWEWLETPIDSSKRGLVGNAYGNSGSLEDDQFFLSSSKTPYGYYPYTDNLDIGFRVAVVQVPEPATLLLFGLGGLFLRKER